MQIHGKTGQMKNKQKWNEPLGGMIPNSKWLRDWREIEMRREFLFFFGLRFRIINVVAWKSVNFKLGCFRKVGLMLTKETEYLFHSTHLMTIRDTSTKPAKIIQIPTAWQFSLFWFISKAARKKCKLENLAQTWRHDRIFTHSWFLTFLVAFFTFNRLFPSVSWLSCYCYTFSPGFWFDFSFQRGFSSIVLAFI